jgi:hypothetical protein
VDLGRRKKASAGPFPFMRPSFRPLAQLLALALALGAPAAGAASPPQLVASFDDPPHDATGPGAYTPPYDPDFTDGDFDLRRFSVQADGDDVLFQVTMGAPFREPVTTQRTNRIPLQLLNGIYLQNIDIYVDTDPASTAGWNRSIPGRRVTFEEGRTWKAVVVITPQPGPAAAITQAALGPGVTRRAFFPDAVEVKGRTVTVRVPNYVFDGPPRKEWGYSVQISGANWERSFSVLDLLKSGKELDAFTMPVHGMREPFAFGGAPSGEVHPRVVDVLLPANIDQKAVLGSFSVNDGTFARVPFVHAVAPPAPSAAAPAPAVATAPVAGAAAAPVAPPVTVQAPVAAPAAVLTIPAGLKVVDVSGDVVSITGPTAGIKEFQLGQVVGPGGATVARVVVLRVYDGGLAATVVEGRSRIERGAAVRFDGPTP